MTNYLTNWLAVMRLPFGKEFRPGSTERRASNEHRLEPGLTRNHRDPRLQPRVELNFDRSARHTQSDIRKQVSRARLIARPRSELRLHPRLPGPAPNE
jgi:hypothetical protein